ncbi:glycosyltransferase family 28 domain-containing protein [Colletotrichum graminicola]|uniref:Glycosyltransferase family 28 domain-containing protein n=1 Tax=Colletotrichum graminicola (strain M1.001 / M2 / FGSC 10212) TaxID=645133 RepID=E3QBX3_COLGM|nr:glycosyltransferase family 28 domain-containing protein [Colletotrichum graminicola M1.001]EFQ28208.1 glycosyltransferase family 28 domain-containing protein [Colletotrichum graminicola M1.001]WDK20519.1 glycosyltransferase family 28 domain-containing protein [Colletotrichum graminicola]
MSNGKQSQGVGGPNDDDDSVAFAETAAQMRLNIVILFMGSRGDLQPSLAIATLLQRRHGHCVRIASHPPYRAAVEAAGVGFYSIGKTDIKTMMERRLLPREELNKLVPTIRADFREMGERWWGACVGDPDPDGKEGEGDAFIADLVMSTMHVYNQTSVAARLGVPLHLFGMNPRIYSKEIPHSQAGWALKKPSRAKNVISWWFTDVIFLQAMKSVVNDVRVNVMGLEAMSPAWWLSQYNRMGVPCTYLWSPRLLPKPTDWPDNVHISGFVFDRAPGYAPPEALARFLAAEETPPVYIGFGSMSFANAPGVFVEVFEAVARTGVRAVVCKGWANLDVDEAGRGLEHVCIVDEAPHAWLFPRVRAIVCHGGSGTTAMALRSGRPTLVVPVAGDQPFWAARVRAAGCGPESGFGIAEMTGEKFEERLRELLKPEYAAAAERFAEGLEGERPGEEVCVEQIVETLGVYEREGRCAVYDGRPAVWRTPGGQQLSAVAAHVLVENGRVRGEALRTLNLVKWPDLVSPGDPVTGLVLGIGQAFGSVVEDAKGGHWGKLGLHILRAPLTILALVAFGLFNLLDFTLYKLASPCEPKLYASNLRTYTYAQMLGFLAAAPLLELASAVSRPPVLARAGRGTPRAALEVPLAVFRTLLALLNVAAGFAGITLRLLELACARAMGERPRRDVVAEARVRQGRFEAERLRVEGAEAGRDLIGDIVRKWDEKKRP